MKTKLLLLFLASAQVVDAQTFTEVSPAPPFEGVDRSSIAFSDVDGDGDEDVLITGNKGSLDPIAKLYTNDGAGNFTEMTGTPFEGIWAGSVAFSDVDGDGDDDVFITGGGSSFEAISKLYINDGLGNFTERTGTPFDGVSINNSIAFSDVDSDGDSDVLITGKASGLYIAKLYINDGLGNFILMIGTPFEGVWASSIAFSDIDGDGDEDVLITGYNGSDERISKLYINDGLGNFTERTGTPFYGVDFSSIAFSDVDSDGDEDVLITGRNSSFEQISKLYTNDGLGNFTERTGTPFESVYFSSIAFSDVDGDGDQDVLITGQNSSDVQISKLYTNDGLGNFTEMAGTPFDEVYASSIAFSDVDGDGDEDVLITGENGSDEEIAKLYTNDGMVSSNDDLKTENSLGFLLFPNPSASGTIYLNYDSVNRGDITIKVYSVNGVLLRQQRELAVTGQQVFPIDISSLIKGGYLIELDDGKSRGVAKVIVR
jgi:hypothetical protein